MSARPLLRCLAVCIALSGVPIARAAETPVAAPTPSASAWRGSPRLWAGLVSAGVVAGSALNSFLDNPEEGFRVEDEGWFGERTYVGGADKASHFVSFHLLARELGELYQLIGLDAGPARALGAGVSLLSGLIVELGDGTNHYGFSWEDLAMGAAGVGAAWVLSTFDLHDLFGFRFGIVPGPTPPRGGSTTARGATTRTRSTPPISSSPA